MSKQKFFFTRFDWVRYHAVAEFLFEQGYNYVQVFVELMRVYGNLVSEPDSIRRWQRKWEIGFPLMSMLDGTGRSKVSGYKERIEKILIENKYISLTRIAEEIKLKRFTIKRIIKVETDFRRVALCQVPYTLTNEINTKRVYKSRIMLEMLTNMRRDGFIYSNTGDEICIYYRNHTNSASIRKGDDIPTRDTKELILNPMFQSIKDEISSNIEPLLHFNNATARTAAKNKFIYKNNFNRLPQPPYSPDLSPSDFYLFGYLNVGLNDITFESAEQALAATKQILQKIDSRTLKRIFNNWLIRLRYITDSDGAYYED
ncbi:MAG: hypothetical protein EZS28_003737 [Streblomastix strix]|uniref:Uncharacterized protein n=1 Tax=Streblomastix strix TaxID=222440 RepID=A0A5J4X0H4_9EUKA|nr:MAG: hypothetical protein EZS28_003737 [Streblomastix strix]